MASDITTADDGVEISFETEGDGPPVILLHGITEDRESWREVSCDLADNFQTIRVDLRGHGRSGRSNDFSVHRMASDVASVARAVGISMSEVHVVGHSLGGAVALFVAGEHRVRSLTVVDQSMDFAALKPLLCPLEAQLRGSEFNLIVQNLFSSLEGPLADEARRELAAYHARADRDVVLGCWEMIFRRSPEELRQLVVAVLAAVRSPIWIVHGSAIPHEYEEWLKSHLPSARVDIWPGAGHWLHRSNTQRFTAKLREFFRQTTQIH